MTARRSQGRGQRVREERQEDRARTRSAGLPNTPPSQITDLLHAYADDEGIPRAEVDALPPGQQRRLARQMAKDIARGSRPNAQWPSDKADIVLRFECLSPDGRHEVFEQTFESGDTPAELPGIVVRASSIDTPRNPRTSRGNKRRRSAADIETIQAGTFTARVPNPEPGPPIDVSGFRTRLPSNVIGNPTWTEGPFDVPTWDVAGRSVIAEIIARELGEIE